MNYNERCLIDAVIPGRPGKQNKIQQILKILLCLRIYNIAYDVID